MCKLSAWRAARTTVGRPSGSLFPTDSPVPGRTADRTRATTSPRCRPGSRPARISSWPGRAEPARRASARRRSAGSRGGAPTRRSSTCSALADAGELAEAIAAAVIANRSATHRALRRARSAGRAALTAAQARAVLKMVGELGEGVELALTPGPCRPGPGARARSRARAARACGGGRREAADPLLRRVPGAGLRAEAVRRPGGGHQPHARGLPAHARRCRTCSREASST